VSAAVATSSDDSDNDDSSLMLAENMQSQQQQEQKFRAKRDLDADDIRELFESQNAREHDNYEPGWQPPIN